MTLPASEVLRFPPHPQAPPQTVASHGQNACGGGGALYSEREQERVSLPLSPAGQKPATPADALLVAHAISDLLVSEGVLVLGTSRRMACATEMARDGVTTDEVRLVIAFIKETDPEPSHQRRYIAGILQDRQKRTDAIANVRQFRTSEAKHVSDAEFGAAIRRANQSHVAEFERQWSEYVAAKKAAGEPIAGPRDAHPWERARRAEPAQVQSSASGRSTSPTLGPAPSSCSARVLPGEPVPSKGSPGFSSHELLPKD